MIEAKKCEVAGFSHDDAILKAEDGCQYLADARREVAWVQLHDAHMSRALISVTADFRGKRIRIIKVDP